MIASAIFFLSKIDLIKTIKKFVKLNYIIYNIASYK